LPACAGTALLRFRRSGSSASDESHALGPAESSQALAELGRKPRIQLRAPDFQQEADLRCDPVHAPRVLVRQDTIAVVDQIGRSHGERIAPEPQTTLQRVRIPRDRIGDVVVVRARRHEVRDTAAKAAADVRRSQRRLLQDVVEQPGKNDLLLKSSVKKRESDAETMQKHSLFPAAPAISKRVRQVEKRLFEPLLAW